MDSINSMTRSVNTAAKSVSKTFASIKIPTTKIPTTKEIGTANVPGKG
jgi:hypothetical protein